MRDLPEVASATRPRGRRASLSDNPYFFGLGSQSTWNLVPITGTRYLVFIYQLEEKDSAGDTRKSFDKTATITLAALFLLDLLGLL